MLWFHKKGGFRISYFCSTRLTYCINRIFNCSSCKIYGESHHYLVRIQILILNVLVETQQYVILRNKIFKFVFVKLFMISLTEGLIKRQNNWFHSPINKVLLRLISSLFSLLLSSCKCDKILLLECSCYNNACGQRRYSWAIS